MKNEWKKIGKFYYKKSELGLSGEFVTEDEWEKVSI